MKIGGIIRTDLQKNRIGGCGIDPSGLGKGQVACSCEHNKRQEIS